MLRRTAHAALFAAPLLLVLVYSLTLRGWLPPAQAQASARPEPRHIVDELVLAVAKVAANEASLVHVRSAEVALIWQVTEARAETPRAQLGWLRAHSSCVLTDRPMSEREAQGNCRWSRYLTASDRKPRGWPQHLPWSRYAPRWAQVRELARRLVTDEFEMRPCKGEPFTWGGRRIDMAQALERGLVPLFCTDPQTGRLLLNDGFALGETR